jgi:acyl-[acyl carrier protein]--UDP-N-acetylglucosamine O-acyltransferase
VNNLNIHPSAVLHPSARLSNNVQIGAFCVIHANTEIGEGTVIESHCEIGLPTRLSDGSPLVLGDSTYIRSHSVFYEGSTFGPGLVTGHHVTVRELTKAGRNLQIGTKSEIQGHCEIGNYVRLHSNVHIGQKSLVGSFVWMFPDVLLTNDPTPPSETLIGSVVCDFSVLCSKVTVLPGIRIGRHAVVGACSLVGVEVGDGMFANGNPAKIQCPASIMRLKSDPSKKAYPWNRRFRRGYPEEITRKWDSEE